MVHGQGRSRQAKDHENKLTGKIPGGIRAEMRHIGRIRQLGKENILASLHHLSGHFHGTAHSRLPKRHVKHMMEPKRNQRPLNQTENQRSHISRSCHQSAQRIDAALDGGPHKIQQNPDNHIHQRRYDRHKPGAAEKGQGIGKLNLMEPVVQ